MNAQVMLVQTKIFQMILFLAFLIPVSAHAVDRIAVKTVKVSDIAVYPERSAPATVISLNESIISAQIVARVDELAVQVGDIVEQGAVLARLDCADYVLSHRESVSRLDAIETKLDLAKRRMQRTKQLTLKQSVAEEIFDERKSDVAVLEAERRGMKAEIDMRKLDESRCTVTSPFRALVIERSSAVGEFVNVGTALVNVMDIDKTEISAQILSSDSAQLSQTSKLQFEYDNTLYPVKLRAIVRAINTETRNREARLVFTADQALPGAAGKLIWRDERAHIPGDLLVRRDGKLGVFTVQNNKAHFNSMPGAQAGRASETSLAGDALLVIEGQFSLKEAVPVEIIN